MAGGCEEKMYRHTSILSNEVDGMTEAMIKKQYMYFFGACKISHFR
jgi:hypothetical protein